MFNNKRIRQLESDVEHLKDAYIRSMRNRMDRDEIIRKIVHDISEKQKQLENQLDIILKMK